MRSREAQVVVEHQCAQPMLLGEAAGQREETNAPGRLVDRRQSEKADVTVLQDAPSRRGEGHQGRRRRAQSERHDSAIAFWLGLYVVGQILDRSAVRQKDVVQRPGKLHCLIGREVFDVSIVRRRAANVLQEAQEFRADRHARSVPLRRPGVESFHELHGLASLYHRSLTQYAGTP